MLWVVSAQEDWPAAIVHCTLVPATGAAPFLMIESSHVGLPAGAAVSTPVVKFCSATLKLSTAPADVTVVSLVVTVVDGRSTSRPLIMPYCVVPVRRVDSRP